MARPLTKLDDILWPSQAQRETAEFAISSRDPLQHLLFYGPPGTGKTTGMNVVALEIMKNGNVPVQNFRELMKTGDVLLVDDEFGYAGSSLKAMSEWARRCSFSGIDRKIVIIDEIDNYQTSAWPKLKLMLDRFKRYQVQVLAATNHLSRVDNAVADRFVQVHMSLSGKIGRDAIADWLRRYLQAHGLPSMSAVELSDVVNRSNGSMRQVMIEIDKFEFKWKR